VIGRKRIDLTTQLGPVTLRTPLVGASGTVGSVVDFVDVADVTVYGAMVAKSVSGEPWPGRSVPRLAPAGTGMLNGIGIQNPGVDRWVAEIGPQVDSVPVPVWGSAVGHTPDEYALVAARLAGVGVAAVELNLSCPNLEDGRMFALDPKTAAEVVSAVRQTTTLPVGAKLSPNAVDISEVAAACAQAGADWVVLTNTVWGAGVDIEHRRALLAGGVGGYSGPPLKPIALRCLFEVRAALPQLPILGCGGISTGGDVIEYLMAGASAVALGTVHFAEPKAARRILRQMEKECARLGVQAVAELIDALAPP
jgi:dihydroorotate dehydrogenase (NAD+) catalytic subunit